MHDPGDGEQLNYFAHARSFLDRPFAVAGSCLPDWIAACKGPRLRAASLPTPRVPLSPENAQIREGVIDHLDTDARFHANPRFRQACKELTLAVRTARTPDPHYRASFVGHVLVELLLDAELIDRDPSGLQRFYEATRAIDSEDLVHRASVVLSIEPLPALARLHRRFNELEFLRDYRDDQLIVARLLDVGRRAGLDLGPAEPLTTVLPWARNHVRSCTDALLAVS